MSNNVRANPVNIQPLLLAIETSGDVCGAALSRGRKILSSVQLFRRNIHSRALSPVIETLLRYSDEKTENLDGIILSAGPGSFTGLRIGYSVAKGLAFALNIPIVEIATLDLLARQAGETSLPIVPLIDARRGELYWASFRQSNNEMEQLSEYQIATPKAIFDAIGQACLVIGRGDQALRKMIEPVLPENSILRVDSEITPHPSDLVFLGEAKFRKGEFVAAGECEPLYLRPFQGIS